MNYMKKIAISSVVGVLALGDIAEASMVDQLIYNVAGQATNALGARLGDEIYYGGSRRAAPPPKHHTVHHKKKKRHTAKKQHRAPKIVITDQHKIQKSLTSLGFYHGKIDGQVNSFETRTAIKEMNKAYGIGNTASLTPEAKDTLIYMGDLFTFDRLLISSSNGTKSKNKKIQTALKIHGFYHGEIDGALGRGSKSAIAQYQSANGMTPDGSLDFEEEYQLISSAKAKNDQNLDDAILSLKKLGGKQQKTPPAMQAYTPPTTQPITVPPTTQPTTLQPTTLKPIQQEVAVQ